MNKIPNAGFPPLIVKKDVKNNKNRFINSIIKNNINIKEIINTQNNKEEKEEKEKITIAEYF